MFTDTDRRFYEIKTDDVYKDLFQGKELFDNSDYPKNSAFFFDKNKKVIMKDVAAGILLTEFIGLRSKMYSSCFDNKRYILEDGITTLAYGQATWLTSSEGERQPWGINKIQVE